MMNKTIMALSFLLLSLNCNSQTERSSIKLKQSGSKLFKIEGNNSYEINQKVLTVKPKSGFLTKGKYKVLRSNILGYYDISVPEEDDVTEAYIELSQSGEFEEIEYNTFYSYCAVPNDYHVSDQWYLTTINAYQAWDITMGNPTIKVAIIDSGIKVSHEDLGYGNDSYCNVNVLYGNNTTPIYYHGTAVAGVIGAKTNNSVGIAGIAGGNHEEGATLYSYNVGAGVADGDLLDDAIIDAVNDGVNIIQLSLYGGYSQSLLDAIDYAYNHNVTVVCCSGNDESLSTSPPLLYPACYDKVIAVGATGHDNKRLEISRYGEGLDIVAPGIDIICTTFPLPYFSYMGTSYAAPQVSAVAALMLSVNPNLTPDEIRTILRRTAKKIPDYSYNSNGWNEEVGYGLLDAYAAVDMAQYYISGNDNLCQSDVYSVMAIPTGASVTWTLSGSEASKFNLAQNSPSANKCTITKKANAVFNSSSFTLTLTAKIYQGSTLLKTKTKTLTCNNGFACTFSQDAHSYYGVNYPAINETQMTSTTNYAYPGGIVRLTSEYFRSKEITVSGSYDNFQYTGNNFVKFSLPPFSSTPFVINVAESGCDNAVQLTFYPMSYNSLGAYSALLTAVGEQEYRVSLVRNEEVASLSGDAMQAGSRDTDNSTGWTVEAVNALTGRKVISAEPEGADYFISTADWKPGLYVLRVLIEGNVVATEKIQVK